MRRALLIGTFLTVAAGGWVAAQTPPTPKSSGAPPAASSSSAPPPSTTGPGMMGPGTMGGRGPGMMGGGMVGGGMMGGGVCPMVVGGANTKVDVKKIDKGVTVTLTSTDPAQVARLQKMAEAMRLMHEAMSQ